jgi:ABC-type uncharacterized transport system substrate-binding protein
MGLPAAAMLLVVCLTAVPLAEAHPHVFVDSWLAVRFGEGGLESITFSWRFDELSSAGLLQSFPRDGSGGFTPAALGEMERQHVRGLQPLGFFVDVRVDGAAVPVTAVRDFRARVDAERVIQVFTVPVSPPPSTEGVVQIDVADPGFYMAFTLMEPVLVDAAGPYHVECRVARDPASRRPEGVRCVYRRRAP